MKEFFISFLTAAHPLELCIIFVAEITHITMVTLRQILISKGYTRIATTLSFFDILIWIFVVSRVITGIVTAPVKGIVYIIGYSVGIYLGSRIESFLAMGQILIQAIVSEEKAALVTGALRGKGYAVTTVKARGRDSEKEVLMTFALRKGKEIIINEILSLDGNAMIITNDITTLHGGTIAAAQRTRSFK